MDDYVKKVFADLRSHGKSAMLHVLESQSINKEKIREEISSLFDELMHIIERYVQTPATQSVIAPLPDNESILAMPSISDSLLPADYGDNNLDNDYQEPQAPQDEEMYSVMLDMHNFSDETGPEHDTLQGLAANPTRKLMFQPVSDSLHYSPHSPRSTSPHHDHNSQRSLENESLLCDEETSERFQMLPASEKRRKEYQAGSEPIIGETPNNSDEEMREEAEDGYQSGPPINILAETHQHQQEEQLSEGLVTDRLPIEHPRMMLRQQRQKPITQAAVDGTMTTSQRSLKRINREIRAAKQTASPRNHARLAASLVSKASKRIPKVRATTEALASSTHWLKQFVVIPSNMAQPDEVYETFSQRCRGEQSEHIWLLTQLYFTMASPEAFDQLSEACSITRQRDNGIRSDSLDDLQQTMQTLDKPDGATSLNKMLRRFHLARLLDYRIRQEDHHKSQRPQRTARRLKYDQERIAMLTQSPKEHDPIVELAKSRPSGRQKL